MTSPRYVFPIVGGRKVSHLEGNIAGLGVALTDEEIKEIDDVELSTFASR